MVRRMLPAASRPSRPDPRSDRLGRDDAHAGRRRRRPDFVRRPPGAARLRRAGEPRACLAHPNARRLPATRCRQRHRRRRGGDELGSALRSHRRRLALSRRHQWLRQVPPERPSAATLRRLRSARSAFYATKIPDAILVLMRWGEHPSEEDLTELLCQRWFRPSHDWRLFEVVALRLARAFAAASPAKRRAPLLHETGSAPYARYKLGGGEVRLHYQGWPSSKTPSRHAEARARHRLRAGPPRPDLYISRHGEAPEAAVLELKATTSASYLGAGLHSCSATSASVPVSGRPRRAAGSSRQPRRRRVSWSACARTRGTRYWNLPGRRA